MNPPSNYAGLQFGFSSLGCTDLNPAELRALAAKHRSRFVEIRGLNGSLDLVGELAHHPGGGAGIRDFLLESDVRVVLVGSSFHLTRAPESARPTLAAEAEAGEALGARWLRVFGGGEWGDALTPEHAATARAHRAWFARLRAERGWRIDLILETHDSLSGTPEILSLFEQTGGPMPVLWDTHHTWKIAGETIAHTWAALGSNVRHVHIKDSVSHSSGKLPYTYVSPGRGEFPAAEALELLADAGFGGVVSLEWEKHWHPTLAPLDEVLPAWNHVTAPFRKRWNGPGPSGDERLLLACDFDHATVVPSVGPYFHGPPEQYEDLEGGGMGAPSAEVFAATPDAPRLGRLRIYYEGGDSSQRSACIVPDDDNSQNRILRFRLAEPNVVVQWPSGPQRKSRVQAELYGNIELRDFYQSVRFRLPADAALLRDYPGKIDWFTLMEFWNHAGWTDEPYSSRFSFHLAKPDPAPGTDIYFATGAQRQDSAEAYRDLWHHINLSIPVPFGRWLTVETHFQEGGISDGRFYAAVTPDGGARTVLFDVRGPTHHPDNPAPTGLKQFSPLKLYTSAELVDWLKSQGGALEVDWDDLRLWQGRTPESVASA